jgi:hypothetical protein
MAAYVLKANPKIYRVVRGDKIIAYSSPQPDTFLGSDWTEVDEATISLETEQARIERWQAATQDVRQARYLSLIGGGMSETTARRVTKYTGA